MLLRHSRIHEDNACSGRLVEMRPASYTDQSAMRPRHQKRLVSGMTVADEMEPMLDKTRPPAGVRMRCAGLEQRT